MDRDCAAARAYFPRGLKQPETGFHFSVDALLLACFAGPGAARRAVDLGTGSGVVGLGLLLNSGSERLHVTGLELNPEMIASARQNIALLGLTERFSLVHCNVREVRRAHPEPESADLVVCNPPYRQPGRGRRSPDAGRDVARFEAEAEIADFLAAAAFLVKNRGRVCFIGLPERLPEFFADAAHLRLEPKRLRCVHGHAAKPARLALVECVKNGRPGLALEPPLILYDAEGHWQQDALDFCPYATCNARRK